MDCFGTYFTHVQTCNVTRVQAAGTQCIDRKWKSLKQWIPKELRNKQKITRDVNESIRDYVFAFVCRTNWGNANTLKNLAELASRSWVTKKKNEKKTRALEFNDGPQ